MGHTILLLIKTITALFLNAALKENKSPHTLEELRVILNSIKFETGAYIDMPGSEEAVIKALRLTAEWMMDSRDTVFSRANIIQRIKVNLQCNNDYVVIAEENLVEGIDDEAITIRLAELMSELKYERRRNDLKKIISKYNAILSFNPSEHVEVEKFLRTAIDELNELSVNKNGEDIPGRTGHVNFNDEESVHKILTKAQETFSATGRLKTGLVELDNSLGGGIPRGWFCDFDANSFNYKTGILRDLATTIAHFNKPWMWDPTRVPLILRISFETTIEQDLISMASKTIELKTGLKCDKSNFDKTEAVKMLKGHFSEHGYEFMVDCFIPTRFSVFDLISVLENYIKLGYEIHALTVDYLGKIAHNTPGDRMDTKVFKTLEILRAFCFPKGITVINAHQLDKGAKDLVAANKMNPKIVTDLANGAYWQECKALRDVFDIGFAMHKFVHPNGTSYLTFAKSKYREHEHVPSMYDYWAYEFHEIGGIRYDGHGKSEGIRKIPSLVSQDASAGWD